MLTDKRHKKAFVLSDAIIGLVLISTGVILYTQAQETMTRQQEQRQERVVELRHEYEKQFKESKQVTK